MRFRRRHGGGEELLEFGFLHVTEIVRLQVLLEGLVGLLRRDVGGRGSLDMLLDEELDTLGTGDDRVPASHLLFAQGDVPLVQADLQRSFQKPVHDRGPMFGE